jgi:hypothetical protein
MILNSCHQLSYPGYLTHCKQCRLVITEWKDQQSGQIGDRTWVMFLRQHEAKDAAAMSSPLSHWRMGLQVIYVSCTVTASLHMPLVSMWNRLA